MSIKRLTETLKIVAYSPRDSAMMYRVDCHGVKELQLSSEPGHAGPLASMIIEFEDGRVRYFIIGPGDMVELSE